MTAEKQLKNYATMLTKFKVGSIIRKKNPTTHDYRLIVRQIKDCHYIVDAPSQFSGIAISFEDDDKYELVQHWGKSSHLLY